MNIQSMIRTAQTHKLKAMQLYRGLIDSAPNDALKEMIVNNILTNETKHQRLLQDIAQDYENKECSPPRIIEAGCDGEVFCLDIPLQQGAFISQRRRNSNFAGHPCLYIGRYGQRKNIFRTLLQFGLDRIPEHCTILNAELIVSLCANELPRRGAPIKLYPILGDWCAGSVTWAHMPETACEYWTTHIPACVLGPLRIDVCEYVRNCFEGPQHGILLVGPEFINGILGLRSGRCAPYQQRPFLRIELECGHDE